MSGFLIKKEKVQQLTPIKEPIKDLKQQLKEQNEKQKTIKLILEKNPYDHNKDFKNFIKFQKSLWKKELNYKRS